MKIIVAVLNWGLGHACRSIPIIKALEKEGFEPVLATDGDALLLLRKEFPALKWLELPTYNITYPEKGKLMRLHFLRKSPQLLKAIISENKIIRDYINAEGSVGGIISDNRPGCFSKGTPSAYLTHQLKVFSGNTTFFTTRLHQFFINKFTECWVPDLDSKINLSGEMSHGVHLKIPIKYLGILSRFRKREAEIKHKLVVLLSGPEPQRSLLEVKLVQELKEFNGKILFIRGKLNGPSLVSGVEGMEIINYLTGRDLEEAINSAELVIARSGYSSIMDLAVLGKRVFFIPTPGQFEQEYLAARLQQQSIAPCCSQENFTLKEIEKVSATRGFSGDFLGSSLSGVFALFKGE